MNDTISLGRVFGVRIGLNWTVLALVALLTWTLAGTVFPESNPGLSGGTHLLMALAATVMFAASILLHELGHAVQARRDGMTIDGITLWAFGGVARFMGMFPSAGAEFRIAIAGPLVSLALGVGFVGATFLPLPEAVDGVAAWLGYTNIVLLVFNLIPALPLDGGRVLRSAMWHFTGDFTRATRISSRLAMGFSWVLIGGGIALAVLTGAFSGLWLAFIGMFLRQAAQVELAAAVRVRAAGERTVRDVMVETPRVVSPDDTLVAVAARVVRDGAVTSYPVVAPDGTVAGLLVLAHVGRVAQEAWATTRVREVMLPTWRVATVQAEEPLQAAVTRLQGFAVQRALVLDGDRLVGLLSITDVLRSLRVPPPPGAPA